MMENNASKSQTTNALYTSGQGLLADSFLSNHTHDSDGLLRSPTICDILDVRTVVCMYLVPAADENGGVLRQCKVWLVIIKLFPDMVKTLGVSQTIISWCMLYCESTQPIVKPIDCVLFGAYTLRLLLGHRI